MIVILQSVSGSPGVSVWSMLQMGLWPKEEPMERVLVEADTAGGVMGVRYRLDPKTDLLLTEAPRWTGPDPVDVSAFADRVGDGAWLVVGPKTPESSGRLWRSSNGVDSVANLAVNDRRVWLFDVGRSGPDSLMGPLFNEAAVSVLFVRGVSEELTKVRARLARLKDTGAQVMVAVTGRCDHSHDEVKQFLGTRHVFFLADGSSLVEESRQVFAPQKRRRYAAWTAGAEMATAIAEVLSYSPRGVMRVDSRVS